MSRRRFSLVPLTLEALMGLTAVPVRRTASWDDFVTVDAPTTTAVTGVRDVHLTFAGGGTGGIADVNWFTFDR